MYYTKFRFKVERSKKMIVKKKRGSLSYLLAVVLMLFITVKLLSSFEYVAHEFKELLIDTNTETIYIYENNN
ncbi:membrane protein required for beta-lactamase induction [Clostridium algifaecis]|uniref:Membrane protein required for beta-lactamase induction n=2 Tax=Clostridium algifaecis TaxID=1472040 RepID=A0ABS4KYN7_9CLOT|nr:membrane protein required for beta-lactamase induction [Clostridium algifaecis]